jgi:hypothetical protein
LLIRKKVFEIAGEDFQGIVQRCPGESCPRWQNAAGDKKLATIGCEKCDGNPPLENQESENCEQKAQDLLEEAERLIGLSDCGIEIDWSNKDYEYFELFQMWRSCEKEIENLRKFRLQQFIINFRL